MSAFRLGRAELSKRSSLGSLQPKGVAFQYEYDFGSTMALRGKVLGYIGRGLSAAMLSGYSLETRP
jgi:hypothetical protein